MHVKLLRAVGAATALYGLAVTAKPELLARPSVWRDLADGLAMACAPNHAALRTATFVRIASDLGDAVLLGATLPRTTRAKAVAVSVGWAALSVAGLCASGRAGETPPA